MTSSPRMSIVMVDGAFRERYHAIPFFCDQTLPPDDYELIWVEYYDTIAPDLQAALDAHPQARAITLEQTGTYHSSCCFNAGIAASRGELILIPDADVAVERDFLERVWAEHQANDRLVMYLYRYDEPENAHQTPVTLEHLREHAVMKNWSNFGACLTVRKQWLLAINGYEQHPVFESGFHANGAEVNTRLKNLGLHVMWHPTLKLYHPWHPLTKAQDLAYHKQDVVIRHKARRLMTQTFQGLDPAQDVPFPDELYARVAEKVAQWQKGQAPPPAATSAPASDPAQPDRPLVLFFHVPKTGGTTLWKIVAHSYPTDRWIRVMTGRNLGNERAMRYLLANKAYAYDLIGGHSDAPLDWQAHSPRLCLHATMLRHPANWAISRYYEILRKDHLPKHTSFVQEQVGVEEGVQRIAINYQTRLFASVPHARECERADLELAKRNLEQHFEAVGILERFDDSLVVYHHVLGWRLLNYTRGNVAANRPREGLDEARQIATDINALDMELYEFANQLLDRRIEQLGSRFTADRLVLQGKRRLTTARRQLRHLVRSDG